MQSLQNTGVYKLDSKELEALQGYFAASFCNDAQCKDLIAESFANGYLLDPHTACGIKAYKEFAAKEDNGAKFVLCSTAQWSKFAPTVAGALGATKNLNDKEAIEFILSLDSTQKLTPHIAKLFDKPVVHNEVVSVDKVKHTIMQWLQ